MFKEKTEKGPQEIWQYGNIIKDQLAEGIIERVTRQPNGKKYCIPHKPAIREKAESSKMPTVYDPSVKSNCSSPSLNECLETDQALESTVESACKKQILRDIKQAFLQVRIKEDRDALSFRSKTYWYTAIYRNIIWTGSVTIYFGLNTIRISRIQERR